jgi:hypothetical protein
MFRLRFALLAIFMSVLFFGCSGGDKGTDDNDNVQQKELQRIETILVTQETLGGTVDQMLAEMDTTAVKDSLVKLFEADTANVQTATSNSQGVSVQYKNGMRGGVMIDPLDLGGTLPAEPVRKNQSEAPTSAAFTGHRPVSHKTIFLNPSYWERQPYADPLVAQARAGFAQTGYSPFEVYTNAQCTVEKFASLSGFGIVHIYSHGWAWPNENNIQEVYLMTGEVATPATTAKYFSDVKAGKIPIVQYGSHNRYFLSPSFVAHHNSFHDDTTFVYLGFCYSWLGNWQDTLIEVAGAGGCVGFDWSVYTSWNAMWGRHLYNDMFDTSMAAPMNLGNWRSYAPAIDNNYWDPNNHRWVSIWNKGYSDLVFWGALRITSIDPPAAQVGSPVTIRGVGFGDSQGTSTLKFNSILASPTTWSDSVITTDVPVGTTNGTVVVKVGSESSNAFPFALARVSITLDADSIMRVPGDTVYFRATITGSTDSNVTWRQVSDWAGSLGSFEAQAPNSCRFRIYGNQPGVWRIIAIAHADTTKRDTVVVAVSLMEALHRTLYFWVWSDAKTVYSQICGNPAQYDYPYRFSIANSGSAAYPAMVWQGTRFTINAGVDIGGSPWWYRDSLVFTGEVSPLGDTLRNFKVYHRISGSDPSYRNWYTWIEARDIVLSGVAVIAGNNKVIYQIQGSTLADHVTRFEDYYFESKPDGSCFYERKATTVDWSYSGLIPGLSISFDIRK